MDEFPERNPDNYIGKFFYFNKKDTRLFPPKPDPDYGLTINFAHPKAWIAFFAFLGFVGFVVAMVIIRG